MSDVSISNILPEMLQLERYWQNSHALFGGMFAEIKDGLSTKKPCLIFTP